MYRVVNIKGVRMTVTEVKAKLSIVGVCLLLNATIGYLKRYVIRRANKHTVFLTDKRKEAVNTAKLLRAREDQRFIEICAEAIASRDKCKKVITDVEVRRRTKAEDLLQVHLVKAHAEYQALAGI
jgi:hypothetical protein